MPGEVGEDQEGERSTKLILNKSRPKMSLF